MRTDPALDLKRGAAAYNVAMHILIQEAAKKYPGAQSPGFAVNATILQTTNFMLQMIPMDLGGAAACLGAMMGSIFGEDAAGNPELGDDKLLELVEVFTVAAMEAWSRVVKQIRSGGAPAAKSKIILPH